jgi:hypothetical protein
MLFFFFFFFWGGWVGGREREAVAVCDYALVWFGLVLSLFFSFPLAAAYFAFHFTFFA